MWWYTYGNHSHITVSDDLDTSRRNGHVWACYDCFTHSNLYATLHANPDVFKDCDLV